MGINIGQNNGILKFIRIAPEVDFDVVISNGNPKCYWIF